ncbi:Transcriptional coactivator [Phytophthora pseudosyringae]|uniref:Transcriptional coactivator n=1 Tax=Phytophthora pseudosyringae TaxID=221518 RepID=A0A8T1W0C0_9STRA|nr:Transcriptional coactivator [Phytophthora pseudosyringae]
MSTMQQAEERTRKRPAEAAAVDPKRFKAEEQARPSLTELLSRKAAMEPQLSLSQASEDSDVPLARLAAQQKAKRAAELKAKPQQKQPPTQTKDRGKATDQGVVVFELSSKRRVTVRKWKAMKFVDIREFYDDNGAAKPGKKGISLSPDQWEKLYSFSDAITEAVQLVEEDKVGMESLAGVPGCILRPDGDVRAIALPLSSKRRITVRYFRNGVLIDLREFYEQDGVSKPGKKGISLSKDQWVALQEIADEITEAADRL